MLFFVSYNWKITRTRIYVLVIGKNSRNNNNQTSEGEYAVPHVVGERS